MKNIIAVILLVFFVDSTVYANVYRYPESPYDCQPTQFYIDYNIDKFNDIKFNDPYLINRTYGTFFNEYISLNNQKCVFYLTMKTYSNSTNKYFGIGMSLYGNTDVIVENPHYVSIKFDDQTYDYPYPVRMGKSGWLIISEPETPELYYVMLNLLITGKPFKIRLDEIVDAQISQLAMSYVADIPTTNFSEAYTYCYGND